jgi:hypothetical protein
VIRVNENEVYLQLTLHLQLIANKRLRVPLMELRRLIRRRLSEMRDMIGYDLAALRLTGRVATDRKQLFNVGGGQASDVWAGMGFGSDVAAALEGRTKKR